MPEEKAEIKSDGMETPSRDARDINWVDETLPFSRRFADFYRSKAGGPGETGHVFIEGNDLPSRWPAMDNCTIAELGFGTGLNFLETLRRWRQLVPAGARLTYLSFERFPLSRAEMARALSRWPGLDGLATDLLDGWQPDFEMLALDFAGAELVLFLDDANHRLHRLEFLADAWFLDGFAPARNPELWSAGLMREVFARTRPGGSFATYSAAGQVRRNLEAAGFAVERRPGYAGKREMLCGRRPG